MKSYLVSFSKIIFSIIIIIISVAVIFIILLFSNIKISTIIFIIASMFLLYSIIIGKFSNLGGFNIFLKYEIKSQFKIITFIVTAFLIIISSNNLLLYKASNKDLSGVQKMNFYSSVLNIENVLVNLKLRDMESMNYKYVTFYYEKNEQNSLNSLNILKKFINEAESSTNKMFGKTNLKPLKIIIYKNSTELRNNVTVLNPSDATFSDNDNAISIIPYSQRRIGEVSLSMIFLK